MNKSSMIDLAKKYEIHIILFVIAIVIRLSISCSICVCGGDSDYYFFGAKSILQNHTYLVDGNPLKWPMGYSLLIVPFFYFFGINAQSAIYPCVLLGALTVVLLYDFVKDLVDTRAALFASLFLIFVNIHWYYSTAIWSDVPALFFILLGIVAAVKYANTEKTVFIYLFYFAAGFACLIRYTSALMFIIIGLYIILSNKIYLLKRKDVWISTLIFLVIVSPQLIYTYIYFGSVFTTGYATGYWTIGDLRSEQLFSLSYIFTSGVYRHQFQIISYIRLLILGFGSPILPFYLYGIWDLIKQRNREKLSLIIPWIAVPLMIYTFYLATSFRKIILVLPALLILSGLGFSKMCDRLGIEAENNKVKPNKIRLFNLKIILTILLVVILLVPTAMHSINRIQQSEACSECLKNTFVWIHENSGDGDIIISYPKPEPSFEYYSQRKMYSFEASHNELEKLISTHNNTYLVIHEGPWNLIFGRWMFDTKQWLNETYGLTHLKTFETNPQFSLPTIVLHNLKSKAGISSSSPAKSRWDVYLVVKES